MRPVRSPRLPAPVHTDQPLGAALAALMAERTLSYRVLAQRTRDADPMASGSATATSPAWSPAASVPAVRRLELIAAALELEPGYFAEYRLARLRDALDERRVGFDAAYQRYRTLTRAA